MVYPALIREDDRRFCGALVIGGLSAVQDDKVDLWDYGEHPALEPLKFQQGASTVCAAPSAQAICMKDHITRAYRRRATSERKAETSSVTSL
jgi:hypothetical protein